MGDVGGRDGRGCGQVDLVDAGHLEVVQQEDLAAELLDPPDGLRVQAAVRVELDRGAVVVAGVDVRDADRARGQFDREVDVDDAEAGEREDVGDAGVHAPLDTVGEDLREVGLGVLAQGEHRLDTTLRVVQTGCQGADTRAGRTEFRCELSLLTEHCGSLRFLTAPI